MTEIDDLDEDGFLAPLPVTGDDETGPYLTIFTLASTRLGQLDIALAAAKELFAQAGRDPVTVSYILDQPGMQTLWDTAERAASEVAGISVKLMIYFE